jgi:hypothetical protein
VPTRHRPYAYVPLVLFLVCLATRAGAQFCPGISPETAQRLFDRVKQVPVSGGYRFDGVGTNKSELVVLWSLNGEACPPIQVEVENCTSLFGPARLQLHVPPELGERCPGLQAVVQELSTAVPAEHPAGRGTFLPNSAVPVLMAITALVSLGGLVVRRLLQPEGSERVRRRALDWGDVGWLFFTLGAAMAFYIDMSFAVTAGLAAAWVFFAVLLFDAEFLAAETRVRKLSLLGLFCFSLLLHWSLASGGPGDLRLNLSAIWSNGLELRWGPAPIAFFRLLAVIAGGLRDTGILWSNLALSSLLPLLLYGIVAELGVGKGAALLAAFVTTAHPLLIVWSGVLARQPIYLFAAFGSVLGLIRFLKRSRWHQFVAFVLGAVLATTSRPEGIHVFIFYLAVLLLVPARRRARGAVVLALLVLIPLAAVYLRDVVATGGPKSFSGTFPFLWTILMSTDFTPLAWIVAWTAGLVLGVRRRAAWIALVALVGLDIAWREVGLYGMFAGHVRQVASTRYESILLMPFAIGVALLIQAILEARTWMRVSFLTAFIVLTAATFRRPYETVLQPFTVDYEYRFLKKHALTLPRGSHLYILDSPIDDIGFLDANAVGQFVSSAVNFAVWSERECDDLQSDLSQTYLYVGSSCAELLDDNPGSPRSPDYARWLQDCAAIRVRVAAGVVEEIEVPARKMAWQDFRERTVRLGLYRLKDPSICALGPWLRSQHQPSRLQRRS